MALLVEGGEALANYLRRALSLVSPPISTCGSALHAPAPTSGGQTLLPLGVMAIMYARSIFRWPS
jgi:hypothetical protein